MKRRILLVEDEDHLRQAIKMNLEMEEYEVVTAINGRIALKHFYEERFDLIILDIMLPEINGFQVCEQVRLINSKIPILFLTAKDGAADRINGLKMGGDDYLTKPFNLEELLLRVKNLIKRTLAPQAFAREFETYQFGSNDINFASYQAISTSGTISLTKKEAMLLRLLIENKNEVVSRQHILQTVWGYDVFPSTRTIDNFILSFRKYFEEDPKNPVFFHSVRGVGYKFVDQSKEMASA